MSALRVFWGLFFNCVNFPDRSPGAEKSRPLRMFYLCDCIVSTSHNSLTSRCLLVLRWNVRLWRRERERCSEKVRGVRERREPAQTKTQIWSVEDYILLAWALLMEAQSSNNLGWVDTGHARKKIFIFQYNHFPFLKIKGLEWKFCTFKTCLHDLGELEAQCCDHFDEC